MKLYHIICSDYEDLVDKFTNDAFYNIPAPVLERCVINSYCHIITLPGEFKIDYVDSSIPGMVETLSLDDGVIIDSIKDIIKDYKTTPHWRSVKTQAGVRVICSECNAEALDVIIDLCLDAPAQTPYCPFCGAKMDEGTVFKDPNFITEDRILK